MAKKRIIEFTIKKDKVDYIYIFFMLLFTLAIAIGAFRIPIEIAQYAAAKDTQVGSEWRYVNYEYGLK